MICFHHNDADGRAAGAIVNKYYIDKLPSARKRFVEVDYDMQDSLGDIIEEIRPREVVYVVDFHFKPEIMEKICARSPLVFLYDHHETAPEVAKKYPLDQFLPIVTCFLDPKSHYSGCEMVWSSLFLNQEMPEAIRLVGDRDAWKWAYGVRTAYFNEGLKLYDHGPESTLWISLLSNEIDNSRIEEVIEKGRICIDYRDSVCKDYLDQYGYEIKFDGLSGFVVNLILPNCGTEMFGERINEYDICIGMVFDGKNWKFSLRSNGKVNVAQIAKQYGEEYNTSGGGHKEAAGFLAPEIPVKLRRKDSL